MDIKDFFSISIPSLALCIALYTFLTNSPRFREFGKQFWITVFLQLLAVLSCSFSLVFDTISIQFDPQTKLYQIMQYVCNVSTHAFFFFFVSAWIYLCKIFYLIFGSLYHLRRKRFVKYTKPVAWIYEHFFHKKFYEVNVRQRRDLSSNAFNGVDSKVLQRIKDGGVILIFYSDVSNYSNFISNYIMETIQNDETVDFITTYKNPIELCRAISDKDISKLTRKLSIIDCFSSHYAFDDKVVKYEKQNYSQKGFRFYNADTFSEIHTATNDSWYRFRKLCKTEENSYRIPHRTIYDTLSSLINFSSEELYFLFLHHVFSSEKSYKMISTILEPNTLKVDLKNNLIRMADIVLEYDNNTFTLLK